jgi:hypothetical protein
MKIIYWALASLYLLSFTLNCEKFTGYDYGTEQINDTARIYGIVRNINNGNPIYNARVIIGSSSTQTNENGEYRIEWSLGKDEERDKPVTFTYLAGDYLPDSISVILYPGENRLNDINLVYASPIIEKGALVDTIGDGENYICQVLVFDYQGNRDIDTIFAGFVYQDSVTNNPRMDTVGLSRVFNLSENSAYFQTEYQPVKGRRWEFLNRCAITAVDLLKYHGSIIVDATTSKDSLLF